MNRKVMRKALLCPKINECPVRELICYFKVCLGKNDCSGTVYAKTVLECIETGEEVQPPYSFEIITDGIIPAIRKIGKYGVLKKVHQDLVIINKDRGSGATTFMAKFLNAVGEGLYVSHTLNAADYVKKKLIPGRIDVSSFESRKMIGRKYKFICVDEAQFAKVDTIRQAILPMLSGTDDAILMVSVTTRSPKVGKDLKYIWEADKSAGLVINMIKNLREWDHVRTIIMRSDG